ncbi:enolase C-terminal domain-like protein [Planctomycetota bacterium]
MKTITIKRANSNFEREPLVRPFGFKGGYMTESWQTTVLLESEGGKQGIGLSTQSVLWSDAKVFADHSEAGGNALMYAMLDYACSIAAGIEFSNPIDLLETIYPRVHEYGKAATGNPDLRPTFALNALVGFDNAAWLLYAAENGITSFDEMVPEEYRIGIPNKHSQVGSIPLMSYAVPIEEIVQAVKDGYFFIKVKIGCDPDKDGDQDKMLEGDKKRVREIHEAIGHMTTPHSESGKLPYYFDANGRYDSKERLAELIDFAKEIGAFEQIAIIEEPFPEEYKEDVSDLDVRIAADESAHTDVDAIERIELGYKACALKAIAKTLSMTLKVARAAFEREIPCFCADLTVPPALVEWNKNVAARLPGFPGLKGGLLETNGHQNYSGWDRMRTYHPYPDTGWSQTQEGLFLLDDDYFEKSGGIFEVSSHYKELVEK